MRSNDLHVHYASNSLVDMKLKLNVQGIGKDSEKSADSKLSNLNNYTTHTCIGLQVSVK